MSVRMMLRDIYPQHLFGRLAGRLTSLSLKKNTYPNDAKPQAGVHRVSYGLHATAG